MPPTCRVIATAGHVDHGKSSLVRALTGLEPDRLREEQARGLTIDLGFVWMDLPSGVRLGFVDVPGHERFIKTMIAGVGAVAACLFVVDVNEGWMPQSEEHLQILEHVGVPNGVIALTKVDRVEEGHVDAVEDDLRRRVIGSFLASAPIVRTSAKDGRGLQDVVSLLDQLAALTSVAGGRARLWVDRSFSVKGTGTVVTGTLLGGGLVVGDSVEITPARSDVATVVSTRVRGIHIHGDTYSQAPAGCRVALALAGVAHTSIRRGDCVTLPDQWHRTHTFDAQLSVSHTRSAPVGRRGAYMAYLGTGEHPVSLRLIDPIDGRLAPGGIGLVRLRIDARLPLAPGDRFVLRDTGRSELVGGGPILDIAPVLPVSRAKPSLSVDRVIEEHGSMTADELERMTGERRQPTIGRWVVSRSGMAAIKARLDELLEGSGLVGLDIATLTELERGVLVTMDGIEVLAGRARRAGSEEHLAGHPLIGRLRESPFAPPAPEGVTRDELAALTRRGLIVSSDGVYFAADSVELAAVQLRPHLEASSDGLTMSEIRQRLDISRKYAVPLAQLLDAQGFTRRRGDRRLAGPRLQHLTGSAAST